MRLSIFSVALATTVCLSLPCDAATLQSVAGQVAINSGAGYKPASSGSQANVGDVVMARPGSRAQLVYADGCKVPVNPGAVVTVAAESPCAGAYAQAGPQCLPGDLRWECNAVNYLLGGAVVAGGITAAILLSQKKDKNDNVYYVKPASP